MATAMRQSGAPVCCIMIEGAGVFELSRRLNIGEYECFCMAASRWGVPLCRMREDFARYLRAGEIPLYMEDWMRQMSIAQDAVC